MKNAILFAIPTLLAAYSVALHFLPDRDACQCPESIVAPVPPKETAGPKHLCVEQLELVDSGGNPRARLWTEGNAVFFEMLGSHGAKAISLGASDENATLIMGVPEQRTLISLKANKEDAVLEFVGKPEFAGTAFSPRLSVGVGGPKGVAGLLIYGRYGSRFKNDIVIANSPDGGSAIQLIGNQGVPSWEKRP